MIIDATDLLVGRFATKVAKAALNGETVDVINCEKAVISGTPTQVEEKMLARYHRGTPLKGPYFPRRPHLLVKRMIRGMLPYKQSKGKDAFARIKCHIGVPQQFAGKETVSYDDANISKLPVFKYVTIETISKRLGGRQ
ncbi:MAG: 50S ribosomal protein L13 [Candidatus Woesearchaeota archaeon]